MKLSRTATARKPPFINGIVLTLLAGGTELGKFQTACELLYHRGEKKGLTPERRERKAVSFQRVALASIVPCQRIPGEWALPKNDQDVKSNPPFVSVIIPVYNGEEFLSEAVESVQRQGYQPLEIIVVDDGSTDGTERIAAALKDVVRYVYQPNSGPPSARNQGVRAARGDVIAFLDADDLWSENKLECQLSYLAADPTVQVVQGPLQLIRRDGGVGGKERFSTFLPPRMTLSLGSALFRRSVFDQIGLLDESLPYNDDVDFFFRIRECGIPILVHDEVTYFYRRHEHNITNQRQPNEYYFVVALKKSHDRRQKSAVLSANLHGGSSQST